MSSFVCIVLSCLFIFWTYLLSPVPSDLFHRVVSLCVAFLFSSKHFLAFSRCLSILACRIFLLVASSVISHPGLSFWSCSLGEHRFYHWLCSLLLRLVRLIQWFCSFWYMLIICLFFQFPPWLFSSLCSWEMVMWSSNFNVHFFPSCVWAYFVVFG